MLDSVAISNKFSSSNIQFGYFINDNNVEQDLYLNLSDNLYGLSQAVFFGSVDSDGFNEFLGNIYCRFNDHALKYPKNITIVNLFNNFHYHIPNFNREISATNIHKLLGDYFFLLPSIGFKTVRDIPENFPFRHYEINGEYYRWDEIFIVEDDTYAYYDYAYNIFETENNIKEIRFNPKLKDFKKYQINIVEKPFGANKTIFIFNDIIDQSELTGIARLGRPFDMHVISYFDESILDNMKPVLQTVLANINYIFAEHIESLQKFATLADIDIQNDNRYTMLYQTKSINEDMYFKSYNNVTITNITRLYANIYKPFKKKLESIL